HAEEVGDDQVDLVRADAANQAGRCIVEQVRCCQSHLIPPLLLLALVLAIPNAAVGSVRFRNGVQATSPSSRNFHFAGTTERSATFARSKNLFTFVASIGPHRGLCARKQGDRPTE